MVRLVGYAGAEGLVAPFCLGYLISDTIFYAIPEAKQLNFLNTHHALAIFLVTSTLFGPGLMCRYEQIAPIFSFNSAWLLKLFGYENSAIVTACEITFAFFFIITRAITMPVMFLGLSLSPEAAELGYARFILVPLAVMQWY